MRRRLGFFLISGAAVSLIAVSTAWACGVLATVSLNKAATAPNTSVNVTGEHYSTSATNTPVSIRLNSRNATPLGTATPDGSGRINTNVTIPASTSPGWYVVLATQNNITTGVPKSGTPGRSSLRVSGAAAASARHSHGGGAAVAPWGSSKPTGGAGASLALNAGNSSSGGSASLPTLLGIILSLSLLGTGLTLVARSRRSQFGA
ncbi:MAG: hypothetical protein M3070_01580 [Actinomycetota bacterium]|nr:hypothetical protein [Actinomycetota bacterium]